MTRRRILVVDDDAHIRDVLRYALEKEGMAVEEAENGRDGLDKARQTAPNVVVLDIMMPEMDGLAVCREFRKTSQVPILFLSSRDSELDRILGLEIGGDDYLTKPFSPRELVARVKVMLRRQEYFTSAGKAIPAKILRCGSLEMNLESYHVQWHGTSVPLTATEFNLLETFLQYPKKVYTRDQLIGADIFKDIISDRTIDSHIRRLRQKFAAVGCDNIVETAYGFGYKLGTCQ